MELSSDWRVFQNLFYPRLRGPNLLPPDPNAPVLGIVEDGHVVALHANGEDLRDWVGTLIEELKKQLSTRTFFLLEKKAVDQWIESSDGIPSFYSQVSGLKEKAIESFSTAGHARKLQDQFVDLLSNKPFLLEACEGWWSKIFPSSYGVFFRLEGVGAQDMLLIFKRGRLDACGVPALGTMGAERSKDAIEVVRFLSERFVMPVQGFSIPGEEWRACLESQDPWRQVAYALRVRRLKLFPNRFSLATLIATKAFLGF